MKKLVLLILAVIVQANLFAQKYYPEGTKWTEIRLDTLLYNSWYSKVGGEWMPNYETIEYYVQGEYVDKNWGAYRCVYTNGPEWTDSLALLISEENECVLASVLIHDYDGSTYVMCPAETYQFDWNIGKGLYYRDIMESNSTGMIPILFFYGIIDEIEEGYFGGVRPLKYVDLEGKAPDKSNADWDYGYTDTNGGRIIQGIGVTEWNDGECLFGPPNPNLAKTLTYDERHYRSMLVHFERDGEVLYDVWPEKESTATVTIDGLNYFLYLNSHEAVLTDGRDCSGEVDIPSEVSYSEETLVVKRMFWSAFHDNQELTKVRIPKTIESIEHSYPWDPDDEGPPTGMANPIYVNPFNGCTALESVEVDEENPSLKSVDGVLFSQDGVGYYYYLINGYYGTGLYCYPEGAQQESYTIPENVEWIGGAAFANNQYLTVLTIPNSTKHICYDAFSGCSNLADVYCKAENVPVAWDGAFKDVPIASATLHVPAGSIDKYKTTWPWSEFGNIVALTPVPMKDIMNYSTYFTITQEHQYVTLYIEPWWRSVKKNEKEYTMFSGNFKGINYVDTLMLLRQDEAKCYFYDTKTGTEHLLFDFSLQKGDVYNDDFNNIEYEVTDVRDSIIGNESLRLIELISQEGKHDIWLEGIGSIYTGLLRAYSNYKDAYLLMCACPEWSTEWEEGCLHLFFPNNQFIRTADMTIKEPHWDRPLETEEDWEAYQEWRNAPTGLNAEFSGDTLHVWGRVRTSCGLCPYISSELKDNNVSVTLYRYPGPEPDCISAYDVDGRIPGFQRGIYEVRLYNKTIKLECSATSKGIMPFVQDGKVWTYEASNYIYDWEETFSLEGDTIINSCKCLKLYYTCQFYQQEHLYKGAMFEEEGKVYFFASGSTTPVLMYDFSYEPGTIIRVGEFELRIKETRLVKYRGEYLKVIDYCILGDEEYPFEGIEGLGFIGGGLTCSIDGYTPANTGGERHLKTCSINGEVVFELQDFYTSAQIVTKDEVTFTQDQMATIILPTAPDASKGKYYRLDRVEDGQIIFEQELQPQARVPYIIVPSEDFSIDPSSLDLEGLTKDSVSIEGVTFIGSYVRKELPALTGGDGGGSLYYDLIDKTPDCSLSPLGETGKGAIIGALRAYLLVNWSDPYNPGGTRGPNDKLEIVLKDNPNDIKTLSNSHLKGEDIYDLSGKKIVNRKSSNNKSYRGIFIEDGKKKVSR